MRVHQSTSYSVGNLMFRVKWLCSSVTLVANPKQILQLAPAIQPVSQLGIKSVFYKFHRQMLLYFKYWWYVWTISHFPKI